MTVQLLHGHATSTSTSRLIPRSMLTRSRCSTTPPTCSTSLTRSPPACCRRCAPSGSRRRCGGRHGVRGCGGERPAAGRQATGGESAQDGGEAMGRFEGRVAIVTGGASGIGAPCTRFLRGVLASLASASHFWRRQFQSCSSCFRRQKRSDRDQFPGPGLLERRPLHARAAALSSSFHLWY